MQVKMIPIGKLTPYENNPRDNDGAVDVVAASLQEFGWQQPIVVDPAYTIIVGHTRWKAAIKLGMAKVPVHVATGLTEAQVKAYRIADNQTGAIADWDLDLLTSELDELQAMAFDMELLGFPEDELAKLVAGYDVADADPPELPDAGPRSDHGHY